jgi:hypothetical protein
MRLLPRTLFLAGLLCALGLSIDARAWHMKKQCPPQPCASPQTAPATAQEEAAPSEQKECSNNQKCPPHKCCKFQLIPDHKSCLNFPEKKVEPWIVPPCPAPPPPCPPLVCFHSASPQTVAPAGQAPAK